ncbi:hypothetical protein EDC29_104216 [Marichromatium gracile]|uniref:Cytochrome c domain-containing protein n=2 Tax=Marichromatium gracile TaxID=1048 RepID=A0A4R4AC56_MARGR|nr:hypothetical protein EDC29_104216 [Marichromatium gracile]
MMRWRDRRCWSWMLLALALAGCDRPGEKAEAGRIPAAEQRPGDPVRGRDALLNRAVVTCGPPHAAYAARAGAGGAPALNPAGRTGRNAELPYMLTAHVDPAGVELVTSNCLGCHAAPLEGELVIGLGNEFLDLTADPLVAIEALGAGLAPGPERAAWRRWADRIGRIADYMMTDTIGVNSANNLTLALMAHRDPQTLAWSDTPLIAPPPTRPLPVSVPPWWHLAKKHAVFYNGEGRGDHVRYMILASTTCTDSVAEARAIDAWFVDVRAYLATLRPPPYPYPIDAELARVGERVFADRCASCHGTQGADGRYPNKLVALGKVGTDPALARAAFAESDRFLDWFHDSFYGELGRSRPGLGYVAPPLDGIWATAPYLHNGAVPTLADLLESGARPAFWRHQRSGQALPEYDTERLGWRYRRLAAGKSAAMSWAERKHIYDTSLHGYGNQGHDFGDRLAPAARRALLEYLKTL